MVKQKMLAIVCAIALGVLPTFTVVQDSSIEKGSLARTGTGLAQIEQEKDPDCLIESAASHTFEPYQLAGAGVTIANEHVEHVEGCLVTVAEGVAGAAVVGLGIGCAIGCKSGNNGSSATTTTTTTTTTTSSTTTN